MPKKIREKYRAETGSEPLTKAGAKTADYKKYLETKCTPAWMSVWSPIAKKHEKTPYTDSKSLKADLEKFAREAKMAEKCVIGGILHTFSSNTYRVAENL